MAKEYNFHITVRHAEFSEHFVSVPFGPANDGNMFAEEYITTTFVDALARRKALSESITKPHMASIAMRQYSDRRPPKFATLGKSIYFKGE
jgi:hypothetical protein